MHPVMRQALRAVIPPCDVDPQDARAAIEDHVTQQLLTDVPSFDDYFADISSEVLTTLQVLALEQMRTSTDPRWRALRADYIASTKRRTAHNGKSVFETFCDAAQQPDERAAA